MDAFWKKVIWHRENGAERKKKKPRAPRQIKPKASAAISICEIIDYDEDINYPNVLSPE